MAAKTDSKGRNRNPNQDNKKSAIENDGGGRLTVPNWLDKEGKRYYKRLWEMLKSHDMLDSRYVFLIENAASVYEEMMQARKDAIDDGFVTAEGKAHPAVAIMRSASKQLLDTLKELGLSPRARAAMEKSVQPPSDGDGDLSGFFGRKK